MFLCVFGLKPIQGSNKVMKSTLGKAFSKLTNLTLMSVALLVLAACSDSRYNEPDDNPGIDIIIPPESAVPIITISGVVIDQVTRDVVNVARVDFFEGSEKATNILTGADDSSTDGEDLTNGLFQVGVVSEDSDDAKFVEQFRVVASAAGYLDKTAIVEIDAEAQIVYVVLELLAEQVEGIAAAEQEFNDSVNENFAVKDEGITLSSDEAEGDKTTLGQAEVAITGGILFVDEEGEVLPVTSVNLEVNYIETQEATEEDEEVVSIADLIPEGLNATEEDVEEVLVPIGVTEVNMTDQDGTPIKKFSQNITITLKLPASSIEPYLLFDETGALEEEQNLRVRTFDTETQVWTTESKDAVNVRDKQGNLYPVDVAVNHLTIFALTAEVAACSKDVTFDFTGSAIPDAGLDLQIESGDLRKTIFVPAEADSLVISGAEVKSSGIMADERYTIYVTDSSGESWLAAEESESEVPETVIDVPPVEANKQYIYVSDSTLSSDGSQVTLTVSYLADDAGLSGVGFSLNYDTSALTLSEISDLLTQDAIATGSPSADSDDSDSDSSTDQQLSFGWASLFSQFPNSTSADLFTITFDIVDGASATTNLNFVRTSSQAGYDFIGQSQTVAIAAESGYKLCIDEAISINLEAPAQPVTVSENLVLNLQCTNDSLVTVSLENAVVVYSSDSNPIPVGATETSPGSYELTGLSESSAYTVTVNTRTDAGVVVFDQDNDGIQPDGVDEERNIGISCSSATGTGTGSS
jgi:hypothetical protein